jgi:hypothetical protein
MRRGVSVDFELVVAVISLEAIEENNTNYY